MTMALSAPSSHEAGMRIAELGALLALIVLSPGCDEEGADEPFYCSYQERRTGCAPSSFGDWEQHCSIVDFGISEALTPEEYCDQVYPPTDSHCEAGCCVDFEFAAVSAVSSCP